MTATSASGAPDLLVDTSVAVALTVADHEQHDATFAAVADRQLGLAGHAAFETFFVLTRLPGPGRRTPTTVARLLAASFPYTRFLGREEGAALLTRLAGSGIAGGSVYDALVGPRRWSTATPSPPVTGAHSRPIARWASKSSFSPNLPSSGPMPANDPATSFNVALDGHRIEGESAGEGPEIVLLHGLSATRRYVVHGSRLLERSGRRVISYDARGHGESSPAPEAGAYEYADLVADLGSVLDHLGLASTVLAGNSMGAATALAFALAHPERVSALVIITPGYGGEPNAAGWTDWDALADGLERGGVDGFLTAYRSQVDPRWWETVERFTRQRLDRHADPSAVADALRTVPRSPAFHGMEELERIEVPALVVGSRDEADPGHPLAVAEAHAERLARAQLAVEDPGESPLAWQGARLSRTILDFLARA